jgi:hypothetical protein
MTTTDTNIIESIMPDVVNFVLSGMSHKEAVLAAINKQNAFISEMAEMQTMRSKAAFKTVASIVHSKINA